MTLQLEYREVDQLNGQGHLTLRKGEMACRRRERRPDLDPGLRPARLEQCRRYFVCHCLYPAERSYQGWRDRRPQP